MALILGIETSCDETAAAVVEDGRRVLSSSLVSQIEIHQQFGGVVPEVAARHHLETVNQVMAFALAEAGLKFSDLDAVSCTAGPGLIGTLLTGMSAAKALAWSLDLPLIPVDHLFAHVCANYLDSDLKPPFVALLVSGGHSQIMYFEDFATFRVLGQTLDDAAGEAYDKVGRLLGLPYPGGPAIDKLALEGDSKAFNFPEGVVDGYDFSFSGLKTAVLRTVERLSSPLPVADLAASFQDAVVRVLVRKTMAAARECGAPAIVLAGGVAANRELKDRLRRESTLPIFVPPPRYCTDNAAMVAAAAYFSERHSAELSLSAQVYSRQPRPRRGAKS